MTDDPTSESETIPTATEQGTAPDFLRSEEQDRLRRAREWIRQARGLLPTEENH